MGQAFLRIAGIASVWKDKRFTMLFFSENRGCISGKPKKVAEA
jgi:hypothetical protein